MSTAVYRGKVLTNSGLLDDALVVTLRDRISEHPPRRRLQRTRHHRRVHTSRAHRPAQPRWCRRRIPPPQPSTVVGAPPDTTGHTAPPPCWHHWVSAPGDHLVEQTALLADLADEGEIDGVHMEGPFVNSVRFAGAQDPAAIIPGVTPSCSSGWLKPVAAGSKPSRLRRKPQTWMGCFGSAPPTTWWRRWGTPTRRL